MNEIGTAFKMFIIEPIFLLQKDNFQLLHVVLFGFIFLYSEKNFSTFYLVVFQWHFFTSYNS